MSSPRQLRIFLASPGDVADERALALKVIEELPYDPFLRGKVAVEVVAWDKPGAGTAMLATMTPQEAIARGLPKPSQCEIVVVVFWTRMGTLLPEDWVKPEEFRYREPKSRPSTRRIPSSTKNASNGTVLRITQFPD